MKQKVLSMALTMCMAVAALAGCGTTGNSAKSTQPAGNDSDKEYKVGIVKYVDDASLDQIEAAIQEELDVKAEELGVSFNYKDYTSNGQADSSTLNQIAANLVADNVDVIIPIATPAAMVMQSATEDNQIPVIFSAVSDPEGAGLVASNEAPGANITGTSDALDTDAIMKLIQTANPDIKKMGLLYDKSQDASTAAIKAAKSFCDANNITYVEKTGTTNAEIAAAADALCAEEVEAVFTPSDNTIMTAELSIFEKFNEAKIPHYTGADSFALNGAFLGYGVNYTELGTATADMAVDVLVNGKKPAELAVQTLDNGIITINTETAAAIGISEDVFKDLGSEVVKTTTKEAFE